MINEPKRKRMYLLSKHKLILYPPSRLLLQLQLVVHKYLQVLAGLVF